MEIAFSCTLENATTIYKLLHCLVPDIKKETQVIVSIESTGICWTYHTKAKSIQLQTTLAREHFQQYRFHQDTESVQFRLNLTSFLDSISIFGIHHLMTTSVSIKYVPTQALLCLVLEEHGVLTECLLPTLEEDEQALVLGMFETAFEQTDVVGKILVESEALAYAFVEISELPSAASVWIQLECSEKSPCFTLVTKGESSSCEIAFGNTSSALIEFSTTTSFQSMYHLQLLQLALKAIGTGKEAYLRINEAGILSIQHLIETVDGKNAFVSAILCPEEPGESDQEPQQEDVASS